MEWLFLTFLSIRYCQAFFFLLMKRFYLSKYLIELFQISPYIVTLCFIIYIYNLISYFILWLHLLFFTNFLHIFTLLFYFCNLVMTFNFSLYFFCFCNLVILHIMHQIYYLLLYGVTFPVLMAGRLPLHLSSFPSTIRSPSSK